MYGLGLGPTIGIIIGCIVVFFICRELMCWYYKINRLVALMEEQNSILRDSLKMKGTVMNTPDNSGESSFIVQTQKKCKRCGKTCDIEYTGCPHCGASDFE